MAEVANVRDVAKPTETLLVTDAMTGQDAVTLAREFNEKVGVTGIVLPDQADLPAYDQMADVTTAAALMTAATGTRPIWQASAWVWRLSRATPAPRLVSSEHFSSCTLGKPSRGVTAVSTATACILASPVP